MTKKDYETLAELIAYTNRLYQKGRIKQEDILPQLAHFISRDAKAAHPRFDAAKFEEDAGVAANYKIFLGV